MFFFLVYILSDEFCYSQRRVDQRRSTERPDVTKHRSAVCLVNQVAQKNNVTAKFSCTDHTPTTQPSQVLSNAPYQSSYECRLALGRETYHGSASTKKNAKEKISREAYDQTRYTKPRLKERTCVEMIIRTNVSLIYEYASVKGKMIFDRVEHLSTVPNKFRVDLRFENKNASGEGYSIKEAKNIAAERLIIIIGRDHVLEEITNKFKDPKYNSKTNVEKLTMILAARGEPEPIIKLDDEMQDATGIGSTYICKVYSNDAIYSGTGLTLEAAREDAAGNYLRGLHFEARSSAL